jgi:hypothetical protein
LQHVTEKRVEKSAPHSARPFILVASDSTSGKQSILGDLYLVQLDGALSFVREVHTRFIFVIVASGSDGFAQSRCEVSLEDHGLIDEPTAISLGRALLRRVSTPSA